MSMLSRCATVTNCVFGHKELHFIKGVHNVTSPDCWNSSQLLSNFSSIESYVSIHSTLILKARIRWRTLYSIPQLGWTEALKGQFSQLPETYIKITDNKMGAICWPWSLTGALLASAYFHSLCAAASPSINVALKTSFSSAPYLIELLYSVPTKVL